MSDEPNGKDTRPKVVLTCMTTGMLRSETAASLLAYTRDPRYNIGVSIMNDRPYESALNRAAADAIVQGADWWLHIDSDQYWRSNPFDAIDHDVDLVGFPAPIYKPGVGPNTPIMCFNAWHITDPNDSTQVKPAESVEGLQRVDVIASGSFLMRVSALREAAIPAPFARRYDANGIADRGCDVEFCQKWRKAGLLIHADFGCVCGHYKSVDLLEVMSDMLAIRAAKEPVVDSNVMP